MKKSPEISFDMLHPVVSHSSDNSEYFSIFNDCGYFTSKDFYNPELVEFRCNVLNNVISIVLCEPSMVSSKDEFVLRRISFGLDNTISFKYDNGDGDIRRFWVHQDDYPIKAFSDFYLSDDEKAEKMGMFMFFMTQQMRNYYELEFLS